MKQGIAWVLLVTDNYKQSLEFYHDQLGFTVEREVNSDEFCQFSLGNCYLAIFGRSHLEHVLDKKYLHQAGGAIYSLPDSENIDADCQLLKGKGVTFIKEPTTQPWGQRTAYFTDPDGHIWELQQWIK